MEWTQTLTIIGSNFGFMLVMFLWLRSEANADRREWQADRREITKILMELKDDMKDFHGRLCAIEEGRKK